MNCPVGKYSLINHPNVVCIVCPGGMYQYKVGSDECIKCEPNYYSNPGSTSCLSCPIGKYSDEGWDKCNDVPTGQPTSSPTSIPSARPTSIPSARPTSIPSARPTSIPSAHPTSQPSAHPTSQPSAHPTSQPTSSPTELVVNDMLLSSSFEDLIETGGILFYIVGVLMAVSCLFGCCFYCYSKKKKDREEPYEKWMKNYETSQPTNSTHSPLNFQDIYHQRDNLSQPPPPPPPPPPSDYAKSTNAEKMPSTFDNAEDMDVSDMYTNQNTNIEHINNPLHDEM
jgi:hypothetical protein